MLTSVSVLIVNYNGKNYIKDTILSCMEVFKNEGFSDYEVLILDNASSDNSMEEINLTKIENTSASIEIYSSKENLGFAKGCNLLARKAKNDILYLLNNDTYSLELAELVSLIRAQKFKNNSMWALKTLNKDRTRQNNIFTYPAKLKLILEMLLLKNIAFNLKKKSPKKNPLSLHDKYFSGCALLISKDTFFKVGGFDENFYFYHEECDLFMNVERYFNNNVDKRLLTDELIHFGGGGGVINDYSFIAYYTNLYRLYLKHSLLSPLFLNNLFKLSYAIKHILYRMNVNYSYSPFTQTYKHLAQERTISEVFYLQKKLHENIDSEFKK